MIQWWLMIRIRITHKILINFMCSSILVFFIIWYERCTAVDPTIGKSVSHWTWMLRCCAYACVYIERVYVCVDGWDSCWNLFRKFQWQIEFYRSAYGLFHNYNCGDENDDNDNFYRYYCPLNGCCLNGATLSWLSIKKNK